MKEPTMTVATIGRTLRSAAGLAVLPLIFCLATAPAQAQFARTFVSSLGNDANDCNRTTPCRTFQAAHDKTLAAGEITVLDPGGYGAVTITKAINIINDGVGEAGTLVSGGLNGVTIAAGATDAVSLRGLSIKGIGFGGGNGIVFNSGGTLTVENCAIRTLDNGNLGANIGFGIRFLPNGSSHLAVFNTIVADNSNSGVFIQPTGSGSVRATLSRVQIVDSNPGFLVSGGNAGSTATINAVVEDSIAVNNSDGLSVATSAPQASVMVSRSVVAHNNRTVVGGSGLLVNGANAILRIGESTLTGNGSSWAVVSGVLQSYGDNNINGNGDGDPAIPTVIPKK
jgi:hypothetical protein